MVGAQVKLRVVSVVYALFGVACVLVIAIAWAMGSAKTQTPLTHHVAERAALSVPPAAVLATASFLLCGLSLRFLILTRPWQMVAVAGSILFSLMTVMAAARNSAMYAPLYLGREGGYPMLATALAIWWGLALVYSMCSYLVWKQLRLLTTGSSDHGAAPSVSQGEDR
jgi:hypothetical protein